MKRSLEHLALISTLLLIVFAFFGCKTKNTVIHIGILQWTEQLEPHKQTYRGVLDGLIDKGYKEGINLRIDYKNVEQDKRLALEVAQGFVKREVDLIVALGTGSGLAALEATEKKQIPIVFSIVEVPEGTGIGYDQRNLRRNITGVSMNVPMKEQFEMVKEVLPKIEKLGIIYCTEMPQAIATGMEAASVAPEFGWTALAMSFPKEELPQLQEKVRSFVQEVDAIYIPTDPILDLPENFRIIIRVLDEFKIPVIAVSQKLVEDGALMAVHCDFYEIGRQTANPIVQVLGGVDIQMIPSQQPIIRMLSLNLKKAQQINIKIRRNAILKARNIFD